MKQDVFNIFISNIIKTIVAFFSTFLLPRMLDVNAYGNIKVYQLYASYIGLMHLGFVDGVYLKYGGKNLSQCRDELNDNLKAFKCFQGILSVIIIMFGIGFKDFIITLWGITVFPTNIRTFYEYIYQATGEFKKYSKVVNSYSFISIFIYIVLILILRIKDYKIYLIGFLFIDSLTALIGENLFKNKIRKSSSKFYFSLIRNNIGIGFFLMLGNFTNTIFLSIDKWFVKIFMGIDQFAYYSFATQLILMLSTVTTPVTIIMYNYFSKYRSEIFELRVKDHIMSIAFMGLSFSFISKVLIEWFLPHYVECISILPILFIGQILLSIYTALFGNLFKTYKMQKYYFLNLAIIIPISIGANFGFYLVMKNLMGFAFATLISELILFIMSFRYFRHLIPTVREMLYIAMILINYFATLKVRNSLFGCIWFLSLSLVSLYLVEKKEFYFWVNQIKSIYKNIEK